MAGSRRSPGRGWEQDDAGWPCRMDVAIRPFLHSPGLCLSPAIRQPTFTAPECCHPSSHGWVLTWMGRTWTANPLCPPGAPPQGCTGFTQPLHGPHSQQLEPSKPSTVQLGQGLEVRPRIPKSLPLFTGQLGSSRLPSRARCPGRSVHVDSSG